MTAAVFLDRDGVLLELVPDPVSGLPESPLALEQVALTLGAVEAVRRLREAGYLIIGVSNQPAAAKGVVGLEQLELVQTRVVELLERAGAPVDAFRLCFHHPDGVVASLARRCECRKPAAGLLLNAAAELGVDPSASWMVGDTDTDVTAGAAAGCRTVLVENPRSAHKRRSGVEPDRRAPDLPSAVALIVAATD